MKHVANLAVTQVRVFAVDAIPFGEIDTKSRIQGLASALNTSQVEVPPFVDGQTPIIFGKGEVRSGDKLLVINRVVLERRRILLEIAGTSTDANTVYESMLSTVESLGVDTSGLREPLVLTETTQCVATLDFALDDLFVKPLAKFMSQIGRLATGSIAKGTASPRQIEVEVNYAPRSAAILENKITLAPKKLIIACREGLPVESHRYSLMSPFDSDTHFKLFRDLERGIAEGRV